MSLTQVLKVAWEGLTLNKVRSFLTTLGVIIGVAAVIIMLAISAGTEAAIADRINALGVNLIIVSQAPPGAATGTATGGGQFALGGGLTPPGGGGSAAFSNFFAQALSYDDAVALAQSLTNVAGVSAEQGTTQDVRGPATTVEDVSVLGTMTGFPNVRDYPVASGRYFSAEEDERKQKVVVLGATVARDLFGETDPIGQRVSVGSTKFTVIGVMSEKGVVGETNFDERAYIPIQVVFQKFARVRFGANNIRSILVKAEDQQAMDDVQDEIRRILAGRRDVPVEELSIRLQTQQDIINTQEATTSAFRDLLAWVAGVSLIVGGIGIMNIMLVTVTERTREIGLRQALGARPGDVQRQFLLEAVALSLVGGLAGVLLGVGGSYLFGQLGTLPTVVVPLSIPLAFGAAVAVGVFFGYYPALKAAQLDPIEALRHE